MKFMRELVEGTRRFCIRNEELKLFLHCLEDVSKISDNKMNDINILNQEKEKI